LNEIMIYSAATMLLMVAASAALTFYCVSVMTKAPATLLIREQRRRRARVSRTPRHASGDPYRTPPREYIQERLDRVAEAAARHVGFNVTRSWLDDVSALSVVRFLIRSVWRIVVDTLLIGLVLPLLPGVQFTGTASTAVGLSALYNLCLLGCVLLVALIFMLAKVCRNTPLEVAGMLALLLGVLATPWAALKAVDLFSDSFNTTGVLGTILAGLVMAVVRSFGGSKKKTEGVQD